MDQHLINNQEWENPKNWKWNEFYSSDKDTRTWVPKKPKWMGWTLNFAKKQSYIYASIILLIPVVISIWVLLKIQ